MKFINKVRFDIEKHSQRYLWGSIALFVLLFVGLVLKKYYYFGYNIADLAIFNQTFFNTIHGRWFEETITLNNYFADHFSPILFLLLPFYAIKQSAVTLLIIQVVISGLCAWPIFVIAKKYTNNNIFSYGASLFWLLNPFVHHQIMYEFHLFHLMAFLFFWSFYFYQQKKVSWFVVFSFLTLSTREDAVFLFFGLALLSLIERRSKKLTLNIVIWSTVYFLIAIFFVRYISPVNSYKFLEYYNWLGGDSFFGIIFTWLKNPVDVLIHLFNIKTIFIALFFFMPFLFVPFFAKRYLLLSLIPFLQFAMTNMGFSGVQIYTHYSMILLPGVYLAFVFGFWAILQKQTGYKLSVVYNNKSFFIALVIFTGLFFLFFSSPMVRVMAVDFLPNHHENRQKLINSIPPQATVCTDPSLMSELSLRTTLYNIDYVYFGKSAFAEWDFQLPRVDYILLDMSQFFATLSDRNSRYLWERGDPLSMPDKWAKTLVDYNLVKAEDNVFLWQNKDMFTDTQLTYFDLVPTDLNDDNLVKGWSIQKNREGKTLKIFYNNLTSNNYLVRFYQGDKYWELPFDYGLYSLKQKKSGQTVVAHYYLNNQVDSFEIYHYEAQKILGGLDNLDLLFKRDKVYNRTTLSN